MSGQTLEVDSDAIRRAAEVIEQAAVGYGVGVRWRSPVGPLQADLAYGVQAKELRLHLRLGFSF